MTSFTQHDRPGPLRTEHASHDMALALRNRQPGSRNEQKRHRAASVSDNSPSKPNCNWPDESGNEKLSWQMWRQHADIEARASSLDAALRHTLLWLGGILLPLSGITVYALANIR